METHEQKIQQIEQWILKNNIPAIVAFLWCKLPNDKKPYDLLTEKQQNFSLFVSRAFKEFTMSPDKIGPMIKHVMTILIRIGFVNKRKGDLNSDTSAQLLTMFGKLLPHEQKRFALTEENKINLESFLLNLYRNTQPNQEISSITEEIRRHYDHPQIKQAHGTLIIHLI